MNNLLTDEELELEDEEKKRPKPSEAIGTPIRSSANAGLPPGSERYAEAIGTPIAPNLPLPTPPGWIPGPGVDKNDPNSPFRPIDLNLIKHLPERAESTTIGTPIVPLGAPAGTPSDLAIGTPMNVPVMSDTRMEAPAPPSAQHAAVGRPMMPSAQPTAVPPAPDIGTVAPNAAIGSMIQPAREMPAPPIETEARPITGGLTTPSPAVGTPISLTSPPQTQPTAIGSPMAVPAPIGTPSPSGRDYGTALEPPQRPSNEPPLAPRPNYERYQEQLGNKAGVENVHGWKGGLLKGLDIAGSIVAPGQMALIPGTRIHHMAEVNRAANAAGIENQEIASQETEREKQADIEQRGALAEQERARAYALRQGKPERTGNPEADAYYSLRDEGKSPQEALEIIKGAGKQDRPINSTPFEAFAYGTPEEKKAAQDFLEYEKKIGSRYRTPNEFDLRFKLFREDPETYRAMFGDKGEVANERTRVADREHATKMFTFFEKQRDEISKNFMLGDDEIKQKLAEIDELEKPFKEAATAGGGSANAGGGPANPGDIHRVRVIAPDGTPGSVPLRQLKAAKDKGYHVAP